MPRPADTIYKWDIRITPVDQYPITEWDKLERVDAKILVFKEGGEGTEKKLHYHIYLESTRSETNVRDLCARLGRATADVKGNAVYSVRTAHEGTIGYVVKDGERVYAFNYTDTHIEEFIEKSAQYRRDIVATRQVDKREKKSFLLRATEQVREWVKETGNDTQVSIYRKFVEIYGERPLPSRSILETVIMNFMPSTVRQEYYLKNIY